ncbi:MAG: serine--tRNA ligase [Nitrospinae bacterium]|nr:serine--tRNA ligase [Nitrospinota bacterium]
MLDVRLIQENPEEIEKALQKRGPRISLSGIMEQEKGRKKILAELENLRRERNEASKKTGEAKRKGEDVSLINQDMKAVSENIKTLEKDLRDIETDVNNALLELPNIPHESAPEGRDEKENPEIRTWGEKPAFSFEPKEHNVIGAESGILDFERGVKIAKSRFSLFKGKGARLERALINFMLDTHEEKGYIEIRPPYIVNKASMTGTGQLPKFEEELFRLDEEEKLYLIPTAEVPVTNIHRDEILSLEDLPIKYMAYTPCFRREAGSYGKDTTGLIRQHQFDKVELVKFAAPETSFEELEKLTQDAEDILKRLNLHYRVVCLCTGDLGFASAKTYDIEVWFPAQNKFREISSCSDFTDFQARRMGIRFKRGKNAKPEFVHTLNGSGLAVGRLFAAILENYQKEDGSVIIPDVLVEYMGGIKEI